MAPRDSTSVPGEPIRWLIGPVALIAVLLTWAQPAPIALRLGATAVSVLAAAIVMMSPRKLWLRAIGGGLAALTLLVALVGIGRANDEAGARSDADKAAHTARVAPIRADLRLDGVDVPSTNVTLAYDESAITLDSESTGQVRLAVEANGRTYQRIYPIQRDSITNRWRVGCFVEGMWTPWTAPAAGNMTIGMYVGAYGTCPSGLSRATPQ